MFEVSAATHEGLRELRSRWRARRSPRAPPRRRPSRPGSCCGRRALKDAGFTVEQTGEQAFTVRGEKPERWVRQTEFGNDEAVGYLADRLARLGVEDALAEAGAQAGAEVTIGEVTFDWVPTLRAGARLLGGAAPTSGSRPGTGSARTSGRRRGGPAADVRKADEEDSTGAGPACPAVAPTLMIDRNGGGTRWRGEGRGA